MAYVCETLQQIDGVQTCVSWVVQTAWFDQLAITKSQMIMLSTPIISIYGLIIAFALFNNFAKRS